MITIVKDIDRIRELLRQYKGCNAQIWAYSVSLRRMAIRLWLDIKGEQLMLLTGGTFYVQGYIDREGADISIEEIPDEKYEWVFRIADEAAGFQILANNSVLLVRGNFNDFNMQFDSLFDWDKAVDE